MNLTYFFFVRFCLTQNSISFVGRAKIHVGRFERFVAALQNAKCHTKQQQEAEQGQTIHADDGRSGTCTGRIRNHNQKTILFQLTWNKFALKCFGQHFFSKKSSDDFFNAIITPIFHLKHFINITFIIIIFDYKTLTLTCTHAFGLKHKKENTFFCKNLIPTVS